MTTLAPAKPKTKRRTYYGLAIYKDCGSYNEFFRFTKRKTLGFKSFNCIEAAETAFMIQHDLASLNLAPRVYGTVVRMSTRVCGKLKKTGWGYVTEIAEPVLDGPPMFVRKDSSGNDYTYEETEHGMFVCSLNRQLCNDIYEKTPYEFVDNHYGNLGWVKRKGKKILVCIDTGGEGFQDEHGNAMYYSDEDYCDDCCDCSDCDGNC